MMSSFFLSSKRLCLNLAGCWYHHSHQRSISSGSPITACAFKPEERPEHGIIHLGGNPIVLRAGGEIILTALEIPLSAFQIAGGIVLFLFALSMILASVAVANVLEGIREYFLI
jgi:hypothetical protein